MSEVIDEHEAVEFTDISNGREVQHCAVYFRGDDIAVVNLDKSVRVTLFKYRRGGSARYDELWDRVHGGLNDRFSEYITDSVELLNAQLSRHGMVFFFDTVDATQQVIGGKHCEDMFGWAVPNELVDEFKPARIDDDGVELEKYDYVCASWEDRDGLPYAAIDGNLPEEAYA